MKHMYAGAKWKKKSSKKKSGGGGPGSGLHGSMIPIELEEL